MKFETQIPKDELPEVKKVYQEAKKDAQEFLALVSHTKAEGGAKEVITGFFLLAGLFAAGNAHASAKDFNNLVNGLNHISNDKVQIDAKSSVDSSGHGSFKIKVGPYTFLGEYSGGSNSFIDVEGRVDQKASDSDKAKYKDLAKHLFDKLSMNSTDILSK